MDFKTKQQAVNWLRKFKDVESENYLTACHACWFLRYECKMPYKQIVDLRGDSLRTVRMFVDVHKYVSSGALPRSEAMRLGWTRTWHLAVAYRQGMNVKAFLKANPTPTVATIKAVQARKKLPTGKLYSMNLSLTAAQKRSIYASMELVGYRPHDRENTVSAEEAVTLLVSAGAQKYTQHLKLVA